MARIEAFSVAHMKMLEAQLQPYIKQAMEKVANKNVIDRVMDGVNWFYSEYTSNAKDPYQRRGEAGGLADRSNIKINWIDDTLHVRNTTPTANIGRHSGMVDQYVIPGDRYTWQGSEIYRMQPFERDFYTRAVEMLISGAEYRNALRDELRSMGINAV